MNAKQAESFLKRNGIEPSRRRINMVVMGKFTVPKYITCVDCGTKKHRNDFRVNRRSDTGRTKVCKQCAKVRDIVGVPMHAERGSSKIPEIDPEKREWGLTVPQDKDIINEAWRRAMNGRMYDSLVFKKRPVRHERIA